jgi:pilus assembly protein CpaC
MGIDRVADGGSKLLRGLGVIVALAIVAAAPIIAAAPVLAQERTVSFGEGAGVNRINIPVGQSRTLRSDDQLGELVVGDSEIADVFPLTSNSLYVLGKAQGTTNIAVYDPERRLLGVIEVEIGIDSSDLGLAIRQAAPNASVRVQSVNGRLRLSGSVPDAVTLAKVLDIASQYGSDNIVNAIRVTSAQQVNLEVRFIEANRNASRELGVSWLITDGTFSIGTGTALNRTIDPDARLPSGNTPFGSMVASVLSNGVTADVVIQALEDRGLGRRLAEPNLTALSGETASFLAGGEVPIPVSDDEGNITIEFKEFGVRLEFTPVVLDNGLINLVLEPEVSDVDFTRTIRTESIDIPTFITRKAKTTVELRDGQSFAIAGLLQTINTKNAEQVPWLGQLPVIGALFRSKSFQKQETDLVIIVTPHLVRPAKPGEELRTPLDAARSANDVEFFLLGMMEVDEDLLRRFANGEGVVGPYGHIVDLSLGEANVYSKK